MRVSPWTVASDDDCAGAGGARCRRDLGIADLAVLGLEGSEEGVHRGESPITLDLRAQRHVDPRAETLGPPGGYGLVAAGDKIGVDSGRQSSLGTHTNILRHD
ncbi:MAG TPA: hypothetical protein VFR49_02230, partial [Solirubrobacteraceae bacterium]|nr:hypothetical protein [Solirubrobacteraceae bacterium]